MREIACWAIALVIELFVASAAAQPAPVPPAPPPAPAPEAPAPEQKAPDTWGAGQQPAGAPGESELGFEVEPEAAEADADEEEGPGLRTRAGSAPTARAAADLGLRYTL